MHRELFLSITLPVPGRVEKGKIFQYTECRMLVIGSGVEDEETVVAGLYGLVFGGAGVESAPSTHDGSNLATCRVWD